VGLAVGLGGKMELLLIRIASIDIFWSEEKQLNAADWPVG
jgi:hypothetical protein